MSFAWLKSLFGGSRQRDISRLSSSAPGSTATNADAIEERVDVSGGPLKEHHRRLALRDKRLLPKVKRDVARRSRALVRGDDAHAQSQPARLAY
jgi:hypothetical protein